MKTYRMPLLPLLILLLLSAWANAQTITGQITGLVTDPSGGSVAGAKVTLIYDLTKQTRAFTADQEGRFTFTGLIPGSYSIHIEQPGFGAYDRKAITVGAQERVDLAKVTLAVGPVTQSVVVTADFAHVEVSSSDHSVTMSEIQIANTPTAGRNYLNLLRSLPGVAQTTTTDTRGWQANTTGYGSLNGSPGMLLVTLDGVVNSDSGNPGLPGGYLAPSPDAISEVKVLVGNYNAEYGARAGGQVNVTVRNGTNRYHGSAFWVWRHETLNANSFFNNKNTITINGIPGQATPKSRYRYQDVGLTFGGPLLIPGTNFNKSRTKVFFFFSEDYLHNVNGQGPYRYNLPTAKEKNGDFSETYLSNNTNTLIPIHDLAGSQYPGNVLPPAMITPLGRAMMNLFPTGGKPGEFPYSVADLTGNRQYNSQFLWTNEQPREDRILRIDYNLGSKDSSYVRLINDFQAARNGTGQLNASGAGWGQLPHWNYSIQSAGVVFTEVHTFTPTLINEFNWGMNHAHQLISVPDKYVSTEYENLKVPALLKASGVTSIPNLFQANVLNLIPNINFGTTGAQSGITGVSNLPSFGWDSRWPFEGTDSTQNLTNNLTWIKGGHTLKFGLYYEHTARNVNVFSSYNAAGTYWFGADQANPNDTGLSLANMLTGGVQAYGEDNIRLVNHARYHQIEWFAQDSWKVNRRLTLELGLRMVRSGTITSPGAWLNVFDPNSYAPSAMGKILHPICLVAVSPTGSCPSASRRAQQYGGVGAIYPYVRATQFDPASYASNPFAGMVRNKDSYYEPTPVQYAPRFGFAWDVFGNGKTAVRGGVGIFYDRALNSVDRIGDLMTAAPTFFAPIYYNTSFTTLGQTQGFYAPQGGNAGPSRFPPPVAYNWSFGVQRDLGKGIILDVSYVGNVRHHGWSASGWDLNALPPYTTWKPTGDATTIPAPAATTSGLQGGYIVKRFLDPTSGSGGTAAFYSTNLIRALAGRYPGYGSVTLNTSRGEGYYNSLQVQVNRRFGQRLQFSTNYTWQKTISYGFNQWLSDKLLKDVSGRPHVVNISFVYMLPNASKYVPWRNAPWRNSLAKGALDGWNISGVGAYFYGTPLTIGCGISSAPIGYYTGTPTSGPPLRCQMNGPLWLPKDATPTSPGSVATTADPELWYRFDARSFVLPGIDSLGFGNTPPTLTYGPGFENWDLSIYKEFRMGREQGRALQFRTELFNAFNHFNPNNPSTGLTYNYSTGAQTNTNFGLITSQNGNPRRISLSLRIRF